MYEPDLLLYQKGNSDYLVFEDFALKYATLTDIIYSTIRIFTEDLSVDVTIDLDNIDNFYVDTPANGYQATILGADLGFDSSEEIPDNIYFIEYDYSYTLDTGNEGDKIIRSFALYAQKERKVYKLIQQMYKYYNCDKPYASTYIVTALTARAMLKTLEISAFMNFKEDYDKISEALDKILT
jgi:hypothetical protein